MSAGTTRKCRNPDCGEWYDSRAPSCYVCGMEDRDTTSGQAAFRAAEQAKMNGHLSRQMGVAQAERSAEQTLRAARASGSSDAFANARPRVPGYRDLVDGIKNSLEEHPRVTDYFGGRD